jgi:dTDP-4-amino-4,6-dideoxygalactose transaminase
MPETARTAGEILSLPIYPQLADDAVDRVIDEIRRFFR